LENIPRQFFTKELKEEAVKLDTTDWFALLILLENFPPAMNPLPGVVFAFISEF